MKQILSLCLLGALVVLGPSPLTAQDNPSIVIESSVTPEVGPYHSKIKSAHRIMHLLLAQERALEPDQVSSIQNITRQFQKMQTNLERHKQDRSYLRHFTRPVGEIIKYLNQAETKLAVGDAKAAKQNLSRAHRIVDMLYRKPVIQFIVAEQRVADGVDYMSNKQYEEAVGVFDLAIDILSKIPADQNRAYAGDLAAVKSQVLALRRQARAQIIKAPLQKFMTDLAASFNEAHDSVFSMWGGDMDMKKLR